MGIGRPLDVSEVADFVMGRFNKAEREILEGTGFPAAWAALGEWISLQLVKAPS